MARGAKKTGKKQIRSAERVKKILQMRNEDKMTTKQIADHFGCSRQNIEKHIAKAIKDIPYEQAKAHWVREFDHLMDIRSKLVQVLDLEETLYTSDGTPVKFPEDCAVKAADKLVNLHEKVAKLCKIPENVKLEPEDGAGVGLTYGMGVDSEGRTIHITITPETTLEQTRALHGLPEVPKVRREEDDGGLRGDD